MWDEKFIEVASLFVKPKKVEPKKELVSYLGLQDPAPRHYSRTEIETGHLTCIGFHEEGELAEYVNLDEVFTHTLTVGKTGIGKTTYFMNTYLLHFIGYFKESSVVIFDAMDGVIQDAIALCKRVGRKYVVLPDDGMHILYCSGNPHEVANKIGQLYMQNQPNKQGDGVHFHKVVKTWLLLTIPLFFEAYGRIPTLQELLSLASENEPITWMLEDVSQNSSVKREYLREYRSVPFKDLRYDLQNLRLFIREIASGKFAHMLNQVNSPSLEALINDPARPVIILRVGDYEGSIRHTLGDLAISMVSSFVMNRDMSVSNHPCLFYIDEGGLMTSSSSTAPNTLSSLLQTARKKRCGFVLGLQNLGQVPKDYRSTFVDGCRTTIIHADLPHENAHYFADRIGNAEYELTYPSESVEDSGRTRNQISRERKADYIMSPDEVMNMRWDEVTVLKPHNGAKRTPLRLMKPKKALDLGSSPYIEPHVPLYAPPTIWEERGYYDSRISSSPNPTSNPKSAGPNGKGSQRGVNQTVKNAQNTLKNYPKKKPGGGKP